MAMFNPKPCPCGCKKWIMSPIFGCQCSSVSTAQKDELEAMARDAARYQWLRTNRALVSRAHASSAVVINVGITARPDEAARLDKLCDDGVRHEA